MPEDQFLAWGWRVPFLLSIVLVATGLVIRLRILETPAFVRIKEQAQAARQPIVEVLTRYPKQVLWRWAPGSLRTGVLRLQRVCPDLRHADMQD
jgi:MFS family permease